MQAGAAPQAGAAQESGGGTALVVGEALVDVVRNAHGQMHEHPGGSPANVAIGLARLGRTTQLSTWFGTDARGQMLAEHLSTSQVRLTHGSTDADRTSTAIAHLDADGGAQYTFDLDWQVPRTTVTPDVRVLHAGSIAATLEPGAQDVAHLLRTGASRATISYDPNVRPTIMGDAQTARGRIEALVAAADVVKVSDEDLTWLYPDLGPVAMARTWARSGPALVVLTRGGNAAVGLCAAAEALVPSPTVTVVDTVGAGDSFMAALLDGLWRRDLLGADRRAALHQIDEVTLEAVLSHAAAAAAITVSRAGANPPTRAELDEQPGNLAAPPPSPARTENA